MKNTARWRDTGLLCSLSSGNIFFSLNEGVLQSQLFLYSLDQVTSGTTLSHKACRQVMQNLGTDCLHSLPFFTLRDENRQKCPATWESDLAFLDTCVAGSLTMTASCIRNNYIPLAAPASTPIPAPQIRSPWSTEEEFLNLVEIDDFHLVRNWSTLSEKWEKETQ